MIDLTDLLNATGGVVHGPIFARRFSAFSYDSRLLGLAQEPGDGALAPMFVAVKTEKGDGHDYVTSAVQRGAGHRHGDKSP